MPSMIIAASQVSFQQTYLNVQQQSIEEKLKAWIGPRPQTAPASEPALARDSLELSARALAACRSQVEEIEAALVEDRDGESELDPKLRLIKLLVEKLFGRRIHIVTSAELQTADQTEGQPAPGETETNRSSSDPGYGVEYNRRMLTYQMEKNTFQARGTVRTQDGKEVRFSLSLEMQWERLTDEQVSIRLGNALQDPLVINFDGRAAELSDVRMKFDLDGDQKMDLVNTLKPHSGFLALDVNGDGKINNGMELFGPRTGDGLRELSAYDSDQNRWIDANDEVFGRLKIWNRNEQGQDQIRTLADAGIGAIYLEAASAPFTLRGEDQQVQGQVKSTGLYLNENGSAGTIQQVDLAVA
ncbi:MAG: hypothetical protein AB1439_01720 [candidate division FCPU426 bacterium]